MKRQTSSYKMALFSCEGSISSTFSPSRRGCVHRLRRNKTLQCNRTRTAKTALPLFGLIFLNKAGVNGHSGRCGFLHTVKTAIRKGLFRAAQKSMVCISPVKKEKEKKKINSRGCVTVLRGSRRTLRPRPCPCLCKGFRTCSGGDSDSRSL